MKSGPVALFVPVLGLIQHQHNSFLIALCCDYRWNLSFYILIWLVFQDIVLRSSYWWVINYTLNVLFLGLPLKMALVLIPRQRILSIRSMINFCYCNVSRQWFRDVICYRDIEKLNILFIRVRTNSGKELLDQDRKSAEKKKNKVGTASRTIILHFPAL